MAKLRPCGAVKRKEGSKERVLLTVIASTLFQQPV